MNKGHYRKLLDNLYMRSEDFCVFAWLGYEFQYLLLIVPCILLFFSYNIILCYICVDTLCDDGCKQFVHCWEAGYGARLEVSFDFKYVASCVRNIGIFCHSFTSI